MNKRSRDSQPNGLGQLAQVSDSQGYIERYEYDRLGRNQLTRTTLPGHGEYTQRQTFDAYGRLFQQFDASSGQRNNGVRGLQYRYNALGFQQCIESVRRSGDRPQLIYYEVEQVDVRGNITRSRQGNGIVTAKTYNAATGRLEQVNGTRLDQSQVQALTYEWDRLGNLTRRQEGSGNSDLTEVFRYDRMNRLVNVWLMYGFHRVTNHTLRYDKIGNITYKSDVGNYQYGANGADPHAVTSAGGASYAYDANGNQIRGDNRTLQLMWLH